MKKTLIKNKNFLNNQNYIFGKTEKKLILSKMFYENMRNKFYRYLEKSFQFLFKFSILMTFIIGIILFFSLVTIIIFDNKIELSEKIIISLGFLLIFYACIYFLKFFITYKLKIKITSLKDFLFLKYEKQNGFFYFNFNVVSCFIIPIFLIFILTIIFSFYYSKFIVFILFMILVVGVFGFIFYFIRLSFTSLLIFPFVSVYISIIFFFNYFYVFFIKGVKGYYILKFFKKDKTIKKLKFGKYLIFKK